MVLLPVALGPVRTGVTKHRPAQVVAAALGDDVDDTAGGLTELGLVAAGLHLHFLDEIKRRGVAERSENDRIRPERAVALVGYVDAVDHVLVIETAAAGNRRVGGAGGAGAADAWREIQRVADAAADRNPLQHVAVDDGAGRGRRGVDDCGRADDVHRLGDATNLHLQRDFNGLAESDHGASLRHRFESLQLCADRISAWRQKRNVVTPFGIAHRRLRALRADRGDRDTRHAAALCIHDTPADGAGRFLCDRRPGGHQHEHRQCGDRSYSHDFSLER